MLRLRALLLTMVAVSAGCDESEPAASASREATKAADEGTNKPPSQCKDADVVALAGSLRAADPAKRPELVDKLAEACELPQAIVDFLGMTGPADEAGVIDLSDAPLTAAREALNEICPAAGVVSQQLAQLPPSERMGLLYESCELSRFDLVDKATWLRGQPSSHVPWFSWQWLRDQGVAAEHAKTIALAMIARDARRYARAGQELPTVARALPPVPDGAIVHITQTEIVSLDRRIVAIDEAGKIDAASIRGHLVGPLYDVLAEEFDRAKMFAGADETWVGRLIVVADHRVRFDVIADVMYTAGRAEFTEYAYVARGAGVEGAVVLMLPKFPPVADSAMRVFVQADGFTWTTDPTDGEATEGAGELPERVPFAASGTWDYAALAGKAKAHRETHADARQATVSAEDDVSVGTFVQTLVALLGPDCNAERTGCLLPDLVVTAGAAFAVGDDEDDVWGGLTGTEIGEPFGGGGLGLVGEGDATETGGLSGRGKRAPRVEQGKPTVKGSLDKDIIQRIVGAHMNEVRHCYNQGLTKDPELAGKLNVQFTIGPTGKVPTAVVATSTLSDADVGNCIAKATKHWTFPKPSGGGNVVVTYPFVLSPE